jgi:hypothetical protein
MVLLMYLKSTVADKFIYVYDPVNENILDGVEGMSLQ